MFGRSKRPSLTEQLATLAECGIRPRSGVTEDDLVATWGADAFAEDPYRMALVALGGASEDTFEPISDTIWHFDTECIEDHGDYVEIATRMRTLAQGDLPLANVTDYVDVAEEGVAWLQFMIDGNETRWNAAVNDDWVDPMFFTRFALLLEGRNTGRRFTYLDLLGQDCLFGCATSEEFRRLNRIPGIRFEWLS